MRRMQPSKDPLKNFFFPTLRNYKCKSPPRASLGQWLLTADYLVLWDCLCNHTLYTRCETWPQQNIGLQVEVGRIQDWDVSLPSLTGWVFYHIVTKVLCLDLIWRKKQNKNQRDRKIKKASREKGFAERDSQSLAGGPKLLLDRLQGKGDTAKIVFNILCAFFSVTRIHSFHQLFLEFHT